MENRPAIALWKRPDGSFCLLRKRDGEWQLTVERDGDVQQTATVTSVAEGIQLAKHWTEGGKIDVA